MSLVPTVYQSTDPSAPVLTGEVGSLRNLLRAVLVTGYGVGANQKPAAGWTEPYTGTNVSAFRNSPVVGTGRYLRVDDSAAVSGSSPRYALLRGYESMTGVDSGVGPTPTVAQSASGILAPKSGTQSSTVRAWCVIANPRWFYLFVDVGNSGLGWTNIPAFPLFCGDLVTRRAADMYHFAILGSTLSSFSSLGGLSLGMFVGAGFNSSPSGSVYLMRDYQQAPGSKPSGVVALSDGVTSGVLGAPGTYPDPVTGGLKLERVAVFEGIGVVRGWLPNVYATTDGKPFADMVIRNDLEGLPTGTHVLAKLYSQALGFPTSYPTFSGQLFFDLTNVWGPG